MYRVLFIAVVTVLSFIGSILFLPRISIGKKYSVKLYPLIPLTGGAIMLLLGDVRLKSVVSAFVADSSVNPIRILILFFFHDDFFAVAGSNRVFRAYFGGNPAKSGA